MEGVEELAHNVEGDCLAVPDDEEERRVSHLDSLELEVIFGDTSFWELNRATLAPLKLRGREGARGST